MVVGGGRQETLDPGFVLLGTRQQRVPVILRELVLPGGFDLVSPSDRSKCLQFPFLNDTTTTRRTTTITTTTNDKNDNENNSNSNTYNYNDKKIFRIKQLEKYFFVLLMWN
ncbi:unnamed protein product [Schistosoma margrebowiei]|uniref:Uncharacterized protein n=1 Tax=Schistosoma margrebowiei TaxID=48269 RepID=A0A183LMJ0_9TREM|nr:unnamed protein product [Schistosoma margrebowiei]